MYSISVYCIKVRSTLLYILILQANAYTLDMCIYNIYVYTLYTLHFQKKNIYGHFLCQTMMLKHFENYIHSEHDFSLQWSPTGGSHHLNWSSRGIHEWQPRLSNSEWKLPWEPITFIFRGYFTHILGDQNLHFSWSFGVQGSILSEKRHSFRELTRACTNFLMIELNGYLWATSLLQV